MSHIRKYRGYASIMSFQNISSGILENSAAGWFSDQILKGTVEIENLMYGQTEVESRILAEFRKNSKQIQKPSLFSGQNL